MINTRLEGEHDLVSWFAVHILDADALDLDIQILPQQLFVVRVANEKVSVIAVEVPLARQVKTSQAVCRRCRAGFTAGGTNSKKGAPWLGAGLGQF